MLDRIVLIVLDSVGVGNAPDAVDYGDAGANTVGHIVERTGLRLPNMEKIGLSSVPKTLSVGPKAPMRMTATNTTVILPSNTALQARL